MAEPDEHRPADDLVEPLFAGLRGSDSPDDLESTAEESGRPDPWKHPARSQTLPAASPDAEEEPSTVKLFLKALVFLVALIAIAAAFYFVFGA